MRYYFLFTLMVVLLLTNTLTAQVRDGEKCLEDRDYGCAFSAFSMFSTDFTESQQLRFGLAQVYAAPRFEDYDPVKAYGILEELLKERKDLSEAVLNRLEKKLTSRDIKSKAASLESRALRELKEVSDPALIDTFLMNYGSLNTRKRKQAERMRQTVAMEAALAGDYQQASLLNERYDLYELAAREPEYGFVDSMLYRFLREQSWEAFGTFVNENAGSPYVKENLYERVNELLAGNAVGPAIQFIRSHRNDPFGGLAYAGLTPLALKATDLSGLEAWLTTFARDTSNWPAVYNQYLDQVVAQELRPAKVKAALARGKERLSPDDFRSLESNTYAKIIDRLAEYDGNASTFGALLGLVDPDFGQPALWRNLLSLYQQEYGELEGARKVKATYAASPAAEAANGVIDAANTAQEEALRQQAAEEERLAAIKAAEARAREAEEAARAELVLQEQKARDRASVQQLVNWRAEQRERIANGEDPQARPLGEGVNTKEEEYFPGETTDGRLLYFTRKPSRGYENIWVSEWTEAGWANAKKLTDISTDRNHEAFEHVSTDGTRMLLFKNGTLYSSNKTAEGWAEPVALPKTINRSDWQADTWFSADGNALLYASKVPGAQADIFISLKTQDGSWGEPFAIGPTINTRGTDRSPVLAADMKTLYFSSDGHGGFGSSDIFVSTRQGESWTDWSEPENLGAWINSSAKEWSIRVTADGERAYFNTQRNGASDIMEIFLPTAFRPEAVVIIEGRVETPTGDAVGTVIRWRDLETNELIQETNSDPETGRFVATLPALGQGRISYLISERGYFPTAGTIEVPDEQTKRVLDDPLIVYGIPDLKDKSLPIDNLFFETASATLDPASHGGLDELATFLLENDLCVEINGHTDSVGDDKDNLNLSRARADAVKTYLVGKGVAPTCLETAGYGEERPVADNGTSVGRALNRRVEVKFQ